MTEIVITAAGDCNAETDPVDEIAQDLIEHETERPLSQHFHLAGDQEALSSECGRANETPSQTSELGKALSRRRNEVDSKAATFESRPAPSNADASHLEGVAFDALAVSEWLKSFPASPEEDRVAELLAEGVAERGLVPTHAPQPLQASESARLKELSQQLQQLQKRMETETKQIRTERAQLGGRHGEVSHREAEVTAKEQLLQAEQEQLRQRESLYKNYPRPPWLQNAEGTINIGVVGNSGVGKSLIINRLRDVQPHTDAWAPVGVQETTTTVAIYAYPNERRVRLLDFPGAGTKLFPLASYICRMGLRYLDRVMIITAGRFTETELALQKELEEHNVPYCMVRTKIDWDVYNNKADNDLSPEQTVAEIRDDMRSRGVARPYLVSLRDIDAYDFLNLRNDVLPCLQQDKWGSGWDDAWALPQAYSQSLSSIQGSWTDKDTSYLVHGLHVHLQTRRFDGEAANGAVVLTEDSAGKIWWLGRLSIDADAVKRARESGGELRWAPADISISQPMVWYWSRSH